MKIYFNAVIFLRTDKDDTSTGHPVDRVHLNGFVTVIYEKESFEASHEGFLRWSDMVDNQIIRYLESVFRVDVIFGKTSSYESFDEIIGTMKQVESEYHMIRVADIRNIVLVGVEELKEKTFEEVYEISL